MKLGVVIEVDVPGRAASGVKERQAGLKRAPTSLGGSSQVSLTLSSLLQGRSPLFICSGQGHLGMLSGLNIQ